MKTTTTKSGQVVRYGYHLTTRDRQLIDAALDHGYDDAITFGTKRKRVRWADSETIVIEDVARDGYWRREVRKTTVTLVSEGDSAAGSLQLTRFERA